MQTAFLLFATSVHPIFKLLQSESDQLPHYHPEIMRLLLYSGQLWDNYTDSLSFSFRSA